MGVGLGFKQTVSGVVPNDWVVAELGSLLQVSPSYGINAPAVAYDSRLPTYLRITDITEDGRFNETGRASVDSPASASYLLEAGDLVFARTGASVGKTYLYNPDDGELVYAGFLIRVSPDTTRLAPAFLRFFTQSRGYWNWVKVNSMRSGQPGINSREYANLPIPLPPTKTEQDAIAVALADADALIESLERLLAKKRDIKQGAMQELLTGRRRLQGFSGEWEQKRLEQLGKFIKGRGVTKGEAQSGNIACVRYGEIYTHHHDCIKAFYSWISPEVAATATRVRRGDILFAGSGETKEEIGKCVAVVDNSEAYAGGDIVILRTEGANPLFLGYYLNTSSISRQKSMRGQGDAVVHISAAALGAIYGVFPKPPEQAAIASVISLMDEEISALAAKLTKARQIKQGMMQELLTGRIRLV